MLHSRFKFPGVIMTIAGLVMAVLWFSVDFRFEVPVLAVVSTYMETSFFRVFKTNFADEAILLLLIAGLFFMAFSREKMEQEEFDHLRGLALKRTVISLTGILLFTVLFIYGSGFIAILVLNLVLPFVLYLGFFYYLKKSRRAEVSEPKNRDK
jgi:amino acid transporter